MGNEDFFEKSKETLINVAHGTKRVVSDGVKKVDAVRESGGADRFRDATTHGFERIMKAILPGEQRRQRIIEASNEEPPRHIGPSTKERYD